MANEKTEIEKLNLNSMNITEEKRNELLRLFPEVRTEGGKIDFEKLKLAIGELVDTGKERYGMNWPGKAECFKTIQTPSMGTLLPQSKGSIDFENTENLLIEGDNLEVLKLLQKSYIGRVKMIYIDPPYNTGGDFIYPDNFTESLQTYLEFTGQIDSEGKRFGTNAETDGRFHTKWLNMIFPRLYLARNLLRDDGSIFISIDDHEADNLKKVCNEVFGEENFIAQIVWQKKQSPQNDATNLSDMHDYILVYAKQAKVKKTDEEGWQRNLLGRTEEQDSRYSNTDNDPRGPWTSSDYTCNKSAEERPNLYYPIVNPKTKKEIWPSRQRVWAYEEPATKKNLAENRVWWGSNGDGMPRIKKFRSEVQDGIVPSTWWTREDAGDNQESSRELKALLPDVETVFDTPKPTRLIRKMLRIATNPNDNDIVLDFFAGSGTTAHAVLAENSEDNGNRRYILVQLPEKVESNHFKTIADITKIRLQKSAEQISKQYAEKLKPEGDSMDFGFRVFKLSDSNFKTWSQDSSKENLENQLELHVDHVKHERTADDILYEILLKSGFPLTTKVEIQKFGKQTVYSIAGGMLLVCLEDNLILDLIKYIAEQKPERVVCLDQGFANNDQLKANAVQIFRTKGIASFKTV